MNTLHDDAPAVSVASGISPARRFAHGLCLSAILTAAPAVAAPGGELDPAFGDNGRVVLFDDRFDELSGITVFPDERDNSLVAVAAGFEGNALLRFDGDGSLDPTFGDQGEVALSFGDDDVQIFDVSRLADGKLLVAGAMNVYGTPDNVVHGSAILARMLPDGTTDPAFGDSGRAAFGFGGDYESLNKVLLQPDGRIAVFGVTRLGKRIERILARYDDKGVADAGFGTGTAGVATIDIEGVNETLYDVVQFPDGRYVACGEGTTASGSLSKAVAVRLQAQGDLDTTYADNGTALVDAEPGSLVAYTCLALADGHLIMAGTLTVSGARKAVVLRLTPDGRLDAGFGDQGITTLPTQLPSAAYVLRLLADGSLAVAGTQTSAEDRNAIVVTDLLISRIDPVTGAVDRDFGDRGKTIVDLGAGGELSSAALGDIVQSSDGKLLVTGAQYYRNDWWDLPKIAVMRIDPDGSGSNGLAGLTTTFVSIAPGGGAAVLRLRRTGGGTGELSVDYRTVDETAIAGTNYVAGTGTITWADGDMSDKFLQVTVLDNSAATSYPYFRVELQNASGGLATSEAVVSINVRAGSNGGSGGPGKPGGGGAVGIEAWLFLVVLRLLAAISLSGGARSRGCGRFE